ncbi:MAG: hypothetical protein KY460_14725 [Actinobacteria bacterium]|nr:hypothetical protein [Actinomycetota bacterium]
MTDFEENLQARLTRNAELAAQRARAEDEMDQAQRRAEEQEHQRQAELAKSRNERHAELASSCQNLVDQLKASAPDQFVVRTGWTSTGEEYIAKISTRQLSPARTLFIELDRDDDEVLARWTTDVGNTIELWRVLEVTPDMLGEMLLQIADQQLWDRATEPPPYPTGS